MKGLFALLFLIGILMTAYLGWGYIALGLFILFMAIMIISSDTDMDSGDVGTI